jgi:hypothetical protein
MNKKIVILIILILGALLIGLRVSKKEAPEQVFCTQEAKQCPDGSYVGRTGPKCEFAPCPVR